MAETGGRVDWCEGVKTEGGGATATTTTTPSVNAGVGDEFKAACFSSLESGMDENRGS